MKGLPLSRSGDIRFTTNRGEIGDLYVGLYSRADQKTHQEEKKGYPYNARAFQRGHLLSIRLELLRKLKQHPSTCLGIEDYLLPFFVKEVLHG